MEVVWKECMIDGTKKIQILDNGYTYAHVLIHYVDKTT